MSRSVDADGTVFDPDTGERIGTLDPETGATVLNEDRVDESVADVLVRVADVNRNIGLLLVELLNEAPLHTSTKLREIGRHLGSLSAECLGRAAELDGGTIAAPARVVIDARD